MKQDCPFCDKKKIDGRHINLCSKNPKNITEPDLPAPSEIPTPETVPSESASTHIEPEKPKGEIVPCPVCGGDAVRLNAMDCRCPEHGDREFYKLTKPAGV